MKYSVLLLYPDYLADNFGQETYFEHVEQPTIADAIKSAQEFVANEFDNAQPDDFHPLLVLHGWHDDVKP